MALRPGDCRGRARQAITRNYAPALERRPICAAVSTSSYDCEPDGGASLGVVGSRPKLGAPLNQRENFLYFIRCGMRLSRPRRRFLSSS